MSSIYSDQHSDLHDLLTKANNELGATLLIPDLQRPYVWSPRQVIWLVDSLIRGWPFGTLLTWKVRGDDPVRELARPFWKVTDRTDGADATQLSKKNPPGVFQMVLDGQQRVQSLLLALGGDGWGFKLYDRDWHAALKEERPRGRRGRKHWSIGCLCVDLGLFLTAYESSKRVVGIDFTTVLKWVVTGGVSAQAGLPKPPNYEEPLPRTHDSSGAKKFVRLSRLWEIAPQVEGIEQEQADNFADKVLEEHQVTPAMIKKLRRPIGSLILNLARLKRTRVTYLELAEFDPNIFTRDAYNDAVVNIFTRLNSAGRTLTREDITFAWLKIGWQTDLTDGKNATKCFEELGVELEGQRLGVSVEDLIAGVSFVWSVAYNGGKPLSNNDLLHGETIRPMAAQLSTNWGALVEAITDATTVTGDRKLFYGEQYQSVNAIAFIWAWQYLATKWRNGRTLGPVEREEFDSRVAEALGRSIDRWLICSQWAGRWAAGSADVVAKYCSGLSAVDAALAKEKKVGGAVAKLRVHLEEQVAELETDAIAAVNGLSARVREQVRTYYIPLWIWHRLDEERWSQSKIPLRHKKNKNFKLDVDHVVSVKMWERKVQDLPGESDEAKEEKLAAVNQLGNCLLLEKTFNISKYDKSLKEFLDNVFQIKDGTTTTGELAEALSLDVTQVDSEHTKVKKLIEDFEARTEAIKGDLVGFVRGKKTRVDME